MRQNVGGRLPNRPHRSFTSGRRALHFEYATAPSALSRKEKFGRANGGATLTKFALRPWGRRPRWTSGSSSRTAPSAGHSLHGQGRPLADTECLGRSKQLRACLDQRKWAALDQVVDVCFRIWAINSNTRFRLSSGDLFWNFKACVRPIGRLLPGLICFVEAAGGSRRRPWDGLFVKLSVSLGLAVFFGAGDVLGFCCGGRPNFTGAPAC